MDMPALAQPPSSETLNADHSLLLRRMNDFDEKAIQPFDGLVGAVIENGRTIVTSPNCKKIHYPPLGGDHPLYLRTNLRYADDDPLLWPQMFIPTLAHLPLIRYPPRDPKDPLSIMWWMPTRDEFIWEDAVLSGLGQFQGTYIARLRIPCMEAVNRAHDKKYKKATLALQYATLIPTFLDRLSLLPAPLGTMRLLVCETQRMYLELLAILDLIDIYKPRMLGRLPVEPGTKVARIIGAFTMDLTVCADLQRAIIPAYLIWPSELINTMRIREVVTARTPEGFIPTEEHIRPTYRSIYRGPGTAAKYGAMIQFTRNLHAYPNPFGLSRVVPRSEPPPSSNSLTNRQAHAMKYSPYARRTKPQSTFYDPQGRNKFEDPNDPIYPPAISAWRRALQNVDRSKSNVVQSEVTPTDFGYAFPEPALFVALEHRARRDACFRSWLRYRSALIHRFSAENSDAQPMSGKAWRTLLSLDYISPQATTSKTDQKVTKSAIRRNSLKDFLQNCLEMEGVSIAENSEGSEMLTGNETWMGKDFLALGDQDFEEILWEMAELNFRQELLALDLRIHAESIGNNASESDTLSRQDLISACFPSGHLLIATLPEANRGLASYDSEERCRYLLKIQRLMRDWLGTKPPILSVDQYRWWMGEIEELEKGVAAFYTQTFFNYFRRAPIIPRRLSHSLPGLAIPPPVLELLDPAPGIYHDMTQLLAFDPTV